MARVFGVHTSGVVGSVVHLAFDGSVPPGAIPFGSAPVSRTTYATLFAKIGTTYGIGDGSTTFGIPPDGVFLRGMDTGSGNDPDAAARAAYVGGTWTLIGTLNANNVVSGVGASDMANVAIGMSVSGTDVPSTTYVSAILSSSSFQISNPASGSPTETLTLSQSAMANYTGSFQLDAMQSLTGEFSGVGNGSANGVFGGGSGFQQAANQMIGETFNFDNSRQARVSTENRAKNLNVKLAIVYQ